jgi:hypothetical protein
MTKDKVRDLDISIKHSGVNIAMCDVEYNMIYIRKFPKDIIDDYITFSIEVINHEFMYILLAKEIDSTTSHLYFSDVCLLVEDRKLLTKEFIDNYNNNL